MELARVVGRVVCTVKDPGLDRTTLLLLLPLNTAAEAVGYPIVAVDAVGAGAHEQVFFVTGKAASFAFSTELVPADASVVGIVDSVHLRNDDASRSRHNRS